MRCTLFYKNDKMHVQDIETGKEYPVKSFRRSTPTRWHVTFHTDEWDSYFWGMTGEDGNFTARQYKNYRQLHGGSGRHNARRCENRMMRRL